MSEYKREILPNPGSLVTNGKFNFGTFDRPFRNVNPLDAINPLGRPYPRFINNQRLKEWQAFQLGNENYFMLAVLYSAKLAGLVQFICYDRKKNKKFLYEKIVPAWTLKIPGSLWNSEGVYHSPDFELRIHDRLDQEKFVIELEISSFKDLPDVKARFEAIHDLRRVTPIVVSLPLGENRALYSHKCLMPMQGNLALGEEKIVFSQGNSFAIIDDHKAFYPYVLKYDWVTGVAYDSGKLTGFNLTCNQVKDQERYNENCLWVAGKLHLLPPVTFSRPDGVAKDWIIKDTYGMVDIIFVPTVPGNIDMNLLVLKTKYRGPFGKFRGYIKDSTGTKISVDKFFGMGEEKYLRG